MKRWVLPPTLALCALAGWLGYRASVPVSDSDLITLHARAYVAQAPAGARLTDCAATAHPEARLVVRCQHPNGTVHSVVVAQDGTSRPIDRPGT